MSHEVSHALARHSAESMGYQQLSQGIQGLGNILVQSTTPEYTSAFNMAYGMEHNLESCFHIAEVMR